MRERLLESLDLPGDLKRLSPTELRGVAQEVRGLIIDVVSANGGHLAPSLGVVDLTMALLAVTDAPRDKLIWDVGHQCYAYKILTDRRDRFRTLRRTGGISGFPKPGESPYDAFATGHASTAISAAMGIAQGRDLAGEQFKVTAVVGDGALGGGMAWEAINNAGDCKANLLVILNDNRMSISPSIGALATHIARLRTMPFYRSVESGAERFFKTMPLGGGLVSKTSRMLRRGMTSWISPTSGAIFEALGFEYLGPIDGHDIPLLKRFISQAHSLGGPALLHVVTTKGKGYYRAEHNARYFHGVAPFNSHNGRASRRPGRTYTDVFGKALVDLARKDERIVAITAAMPDGTGLNRFARKFPARFFNVGIAEAHAVTFAAGLAATGLKPVVAVYSTFMQRAYDQIVHDVCLQNLPVIFALDRAGIVGEDGPTHHGAFDLSFLRHIPNLTIMAPKDAAELVNMLITAVGIGGPAAIRYPRGEAYGSRAVIRTPLPVGKAEVLLEGGDAAIIAVGTLVNPALDAAEELRRSGIHARVINARFVKPLDEDAIVSAARDCGAIVLAEENAAQGGFAGAALECLARNRVTGCRIEALGIPDQFVSQGKPSELRANCGLDADGIADAVHRVLAPNLQPLTSSLREGRFVIRQSI